MGLTFQWGGRQTSTLTYTVHSTVRVWRSWRSRTGARGVLTERTAYKWERTEKLAMLASQAEGRQTQRPERGGRSGRAEPGDKCRCCITPSGLEGNEVPLEAFVPQATFCVVQVSVFLFHWFNLQYTISSLICV